MSDLLHRYWLKFEPPLAGSPIGVGVTAYTLDDALRLLSTELGEGPVAMPVQVHDGVEFNDLDQGHVVPNMHPFIERGVWFPKLSPYS